MIGRWHDPLRRVDVVSGADYDKLAAALREATELRESDLDAADEFTLRWRELLGSPSDFPA
jgi:hypothetical protein